MRAELSTVSSTTASAEEEEEVTLLPEEEIVLPNQANDEVLLTPIEDKALSSPVELVDE